MSNLVDNPLLLTSTFENIQVMDSEGNFPYDPDDHCYASGGCSILGGSGVAPDNYWFLGGPDYGTFIDAGGVWSSKETPGGGKSILLDVTNPLVAQSGGITQVIPINQTEAKPIRLSAYVAAEGCTGNPLINLGFIGYPPGWPSVGGGEISFDIGTYDFVLKKKTFIPTLPVKYMFLHLLHRGFSAGKAWYGEFSVEELAISQVSLPPGNCVINPNFFYSGDEVTPTGWDVINATMVEEINPLGTIAMLLKPNSMLQQKNICIDTGLMKQKISVYAMSQSVSVFQLKATVLDRYRNKIDEKTVKFQVSNKWETTDIYVLSTAFAEKADIEITNIDGASGYIGGVLLTAQEFTPSRIVNVEPAKITVEVPAVNEDTTAVVTLDETVNSKHIELNISEENSIIYLTNGQIDSFAASLVNKPFMLIKKAVMNQLSDAEYSLATWTNDILGIEVDGVDMDRFLRIPHVVSPDYWLETTGGSIPAEDKRYYCVTAVTEYGETDRSNEVRAITSSGSSENRVPIEICPVEGAFSYRIYMTQQEASEQPWEYSAYDIKELVWNDGEPHLVTELTAEQLRDAGYVFYDCGEELLPGLPPTSNTAARWYVDNINEKVVFDSASLPAVEVQALYSVAENAKAILYLPHADKYYLSTETGIYESDIFTPDRMTNIVESNDIAALSYNNGLWYMTAVGDVKNLSGTSYPGVGAFTGFCFLDDDRIARITATGQTKIFDLAGNILKEVDLEMECSGLAAYFGNLVTVSIQLNKFLVFNLNGQILQSIDGPISGMSAWNISGVNLVTIADFGVTLFRILCKDYYAKLDKGVYLSNNPQQPFIARELLPGEVEQPIYPEILTNGTFVNGTELPGGFSIIGPPEITVGISQETAVAGTRALYFKFPTASWKSINKYSIPIVGGKQYCFSLYNKATINSTGLLGITFKKDGQGSETFYSIQYEPEYKNRQVVVQAPVDAETVDFRYLVYGSELQETTYLINNLSIKEEDAPEITFEHIFNGDFTVAPAGANMPSGWEITGEGYDVAVTAIENPSMQSQGKAFKIALPEYEQAGWTALQSQAFEIDAGDSLEISFYYRKGKADNASMQVSIYYLYPDGAWGPSSHNSVSVSGGTSNIVKTIFGPNPDGFPKARLRIWPQFNDTNWIELCSVMPIVQTNLVQNHDFSSGLSGWYAFPGVSVEDSIFHSALKCAKISVDGETITYADLRQNITLNQTERKKISFSAWGAGEYITGWGYLMFEIAVVLNDNTTVWNPAGDAQKWPGGTFSWTQVNFDYIAPEGKTVKSVEIHLGLGWGSKGTAWLDDVFVTEESSAPDVDELLLDIPYEELNTGTIRQIKINAQLKNNGNEITQQGINVDFEASPPLGSFIVLPTNSLGRANAIYTLQETAVQVTLKAKYGALETSKTVTVYPLVDKNALEPQIGELPPKVSQLNMEIFVPRTKKPLPDVTERIGRWEVFRPTLFNVKQMLDYDLHYSPETSWAELRPSLIAQIYPRLLLFHYFDDLSEYPSQSNWKEIMSLRKEWFCVDAVGLSSPFGDGRYYYNWRNMETVQWYVDRLIREHATWSDGIYIDDFWGEGYNTLVDFEWGAEASSLLNFRTVRERLEANAKRLRLLRDELHRRGKYLTTNFGCSRHFNPDGSLTPNTELLAMPFDGYLLECWLYTWTLNPEEITTEGFNLAFVKNEIDFIKWTGDNGKWVACLSRSSSQLYAARIFSLAAFLMGKHAHAYYAHSDWLIYPYGQGCHDQLQPEAFIKTGFPLENYQLDNGLFSRQFENCVALLNMDDALQYYTLPSGTWYSMRGQEYSGTISISRRQGLVLVKERP